MAGYSGTPLPKKLGIVPGCRFAVRHAPDGFAETLGDLPRRASGDVRCGRASTS